MSPTVFEAAGGSSAISALASAWYERCLADPIASHPFSHPGHPQHLERLAAYWSEALGGPADYTASMGDHSHVVRMHSGNGEHRELDERAIACFDLALDDAGIPADQRLRATLKEWFRWSTTTSMGAHPKSADEVPDGLQMPIWSWDGPQQSPQ